MNLSSSITADEKAQLVKELCLVNGGSGNEDPVCAYVRDALRASGYKKSITTDSMANLYLGLDEAKASGKPIIALDAHSDEVGFLVQAIMPNGLVRIVSAGSVVPQSMTAQLLQLRSTSGKWIPAVVSSLPPHFHGQSSADLKVEDLTVDVGALSRKEAVEHYGVELGAPIVFNGVFNYDKTNGMILSKNFDDRMGVASTVLAVAQTEDEELPVAVVGVLSGQEEVGTRGAFVSAKHVGASVTIALEATPSDSRQPNPELHQAEMGKGVQIRLRDPGMVAHPFFSRWAIKELEKAGVEHQVAVRVSGGTNAGKIHLSGKNGIPCLVMSTPTLYAHAPYSYALMGDFDSTVKAVLTVIRKITPEIIKGFYNRF